MQNGKVSKDDCALTMMIVFCAMSIEKVFYDVFVKLLFHQNCFVKWISFVWLLLIKEFRTILGN